MRNFKLLLDLACGRRLPEEEGGAARRLQLILLSGIGTAVFAALYGLAAGSTDMALMLGDVWKVPMVLLLSAAAALPGGLLAWRLLAGEKPASELLLAVSVANFTAAMVLAVLAPIVALYYHSSSMAGGATAMIACGLALVSGAAILMRTIWSRVGSPLDWRIGVPMSAVMGLQLVAMIQFVALASPILPEITVFDGGVDAIVGSK